MSVFLHRTCLFLLDGFSGNFIFDDFRTSVEEIKVSLKTDMNDGYFTRIRMYIYDNNSLHSKQMNKPITSATTHYIIPVTISVITDCLH